MKLRAFEPLDAAHPAVATPLNCPACGTAFRAGDLVTLVPVGATDDPRILSGVPVHVDCAKAAGLDVEAAPTIDPLNKHLVAVQGGDVIIMNPPRRLSPRDALVHAAWLVTMAEALDDGADFSEALAAVRKT